MIDRRSLLAGAGLAAGTVPGLASSSMVQGAPLVRSSLTPLPATPPPVTQILAKYIVSARHADLPDRVRTEGKRTLLNWVGVAVGGSQHETVGIALRALSQLGTSKDASLLGRRERLDMMNAAFVNGVSSHIFDFDDTHLKTIIHPAGPVASALLAFCERRSTVGRPVSGTTFLNALSLGVEVECRIGNAVYPNHYDVGWHITGTAGVFGAAAAIAKVMNLDEQRTIYALGLAASQPVGLRESFGSMNKSFNPGRAAANGLFAAVLAEQGFTSSNMMIEAKRGWANTVSTKQDYAQITEGLGTRFEAALNTYKPFACGIVLHPIIDAVITLRNKYRLDAENVVRIEMRVNPLVLELTGKSAPQTGLEGKFSVYHAAAIALIAGAAGERQFSDSAIRDVPVVALRKRVFPTVDPTIRPEQAEVSITMAGGQAVRQRIEHAVGSLERPMSDKDLEAKFEGLSVGILPAERARRAIDLCWNVENLSDVSVIPRVCALT